MNKSFTAWVWRCFVLHVLGVLDPLTDSLFQNLASLPQLIYLVHPKKVMKESLAQLEQHQSGIKRKCKPKITELRGSNKTGQLILSHNQESSLNQSTNERGPWCSQWLQVQILCACILVPLCANMFPCSSTLQKYSFIPSFSWCAQTIPSTTKLYCSAGLVRCKAQPNKQCGQDCTRFISLFHIH